MSRNRSHWSYVKKWHETRRGFVHQMQSLGTCVCVRVCVCVLGGFFLFLFRFFNGGGVLTWLRALSSRSPVSSLFKTCWGASVTEGSPFVSSAVRSTAAAHLSLVIPIAAFNLAVFFRDPPSLSSLPISLLTKRVGFNFICFWSGSNFFYLFIFYSFLCEQETNRGEEQQNHQRPSRKTSCWFVVKTFKCVWSTKANIYHQNTVREWCATAVH